MACNDFETFGDQDNFIDKLMDRTTYDALRSKCDIYEGTWSDEKTNCILEN